MGHVDEPQEVAFEREDIVDEHEAEVRGRDDPIDDVPQGRIASLKRQRLDVCGTTTVGRVRNDNGWTCVERPRLDVSGTTTVGRVWNAELFLKTCPVFFIFKHG